MTTDEIASIPDGTDEQRLPRATPEDLSIDPAAITSLTEAIDDEDARVHSLMIVRAGQVVAEYAWHPYRLDLPHTMFSVSKSFTSTAVGLAEAEGLLSVDEPVLACFPTYATPAVRASAGDVRLRDLLTMTTGHEVDTMDVMRAQPEEDWVRDFLDTPFVYPPGQHFLYNSGASYVLAAAVTARTGCSLIDYLTPRLFRPLGIPVPPWAESPRGIALGGSGLRLTTEDLAKFGLLYLQDGMWNGSRVLPEGWSSRATGRHTPTASHAPDWAQGYGFQFWRSLHNSYRADGAYGQFSLVLPDQDVVVAITAGTPENWRIPPLVWEHLLPGIGQLPAAGSSADEAGATKVPASATLAARAPSSNAHGVLRAGDRAHLRLPFTTLGIDEVDLRPLPEGGVELELKRAGHVAERSVVLTDRWTESVSQVWPFEDMEEVLLASRGGWQDDRVLTVQQRAIETAFTRDWRITFGSDHDVTIEVGLDLPYWSTRSETLHTTWE